VQQPRRSQNGGGAVAISTSRQLLADVTGAAVAVHTRLPVGVISVGLRMSAATTALLESSHRGTFPRLKPILRSRASVSEHALLFCVTSKPG
jgi:hypothetical protein